MRIATLQFSPTLGALTTNMHRATTLLNTSLSTLQNLDLLVLPELAFTGYNFRSLSAITPYLEPTSAGPSTKWALATAKRLGCVVSVGYPEVRASGAGKREREKRYNSTVTVSASGKVLAHYRKAFLYDTDETWADEGGKGFWAGELPLPLHTSTGSMATATTTIGTTSAPHSSSPPPTSSAKTTPTALGICMDLNPQHFTAPFSAYEFATHILTSRSTLAVLSMAWLTRLPRSLLFEKPYCQDPDTETLAYWIERLRPVVEASRKTSRRRREECADGVGQVVLVFANRCGVEPGSPFRGQGQGQGQGLGQGEGRAEAEVEVEAVREGTEEARYAGTSCVLGVRDGEVRIWGIMGRAEEGVLVVDTSVEAEMVVRRPLG